jgi:hypothetical protein
MFPLMSAVNTLPNARKLIASTAPDANVKQTSRASRASCSPGRGICARDNERRAARLREQYFASPHQEP